MSNTREIVVVSGVRVAMGDDGDALKEMPLLGLVAGRELLRYLSFLHNCLA